MSLTLDLLNGLRDEFRRIGELRIGEGDTWFEGVKRAAIIKSFEFCLEVYTDDETGNPFFLAPTLRGICEDLIAVAFLQYLPEKERDRAAILKAIIASIEASEKQERFFNKVRPWQPVVTYPDAEKRKRRCKDELRSIGRSRGLLTHDVATMTRYAYERVRAGKPMPGVFEVGRTVPIGLAIEEILLIARYSLEGEWEGQVRYLPLGLLHGRPCFQRRYDLLPVGV